MPIGDPFIQVDLRNFQETTLRLGKSREFMLVALNQALRKLGGLLTPRVKAETPRGANHKLANTTVYQVLGKVEDMRLEIRQSAFSQKGFPYGVAVRMGTRPHFPPIDALVPWVRAILHVPEERVRSVAFLVARKISRVGTEPNPYHIRVFEASQHEIVETLGEAATNFVARIADVPEVRL